MRYLYSLNQKTSIPSPTVIFELIKRNPITYELPVKIYRHDRTDKNFEFGVHIATISMVEGNVTITFEAGY